MLTRDDRTVDDAVDVLDSIAGLGVTHIGFKDVGVSPARAAELVRRINAAGATSYLEVVSTSAEAALGSVRLGREIGIDRLLGGALAQLDDALAILAGSAVEYLPFPG